MIVGAWKEPHPGWTISKNGPQGFLMGAAKGVVRRLPMNVDLICDYIPVDVVVNQILVVAATASINKCVQLHFLLSSLFNVNHCIVQFQGIANLSLHIQLLQSIPLACGPAKGERIPA